MIAIVLGVNVAYFGVGKSSDSNYKPINFTKLSNFKYVYPEPGVTKRSKSVPAAIRDLDGQKISIQGFMLPYEVDMDGNVKEFSLNGSFDMCYYGAPVEINEWIMVDNAESNVKVKYTHLPIEINGVLEVGEKFKGGKVMSLYRLRLENVGS